MSRFLLTCLVVGLLSTSCLGWPSSTICPDSSWIEYDGSCYRYFPNTVTRDAAKQNCRRLGSGSDLASVHTAEENTFIYLFVLSQTSSTPLPWISLNDIILEGTYVNDDGSKFDYMAWNNGEPNNYGGNEDCAQMRLVNQDWGWNDVPCTRTFSYVCKIATPCNN